MSIALLHDMQVSISVNDLNCRSVNMQNFPTVIGSVGEFLGGDSSGHLSYMDLSGGGAIMNITSSDNSIDITGSTIKNLQLDPDIGLNTPITSFLAQGIDGTTVSISPTTGIVPTFQIYSLSGETILDNNMTSSNITLSNSAVGTIELDSTSNHIEISDLSSNSLTLLPTGLLTQNTDGSTVNINVNDPYYTIITSNVDNTILSQIGKGTISAQHGVCNLGMNAGEESIGIYAIDTSSSAIKKFPSSHLRFLG